MEISLNRSKSRSDTAEKLTKMKLRKFLKLEKDERAHEWPAEWPAGQHETVRAGE